MSAVDAAVREQVERLVVDSAMFIDRDELDAWVDCFEPDGRYIVLPRENRILGHPVGIIHCENRARIQDRIVCLSHANKYNPHFDRHIVSASRINDVTDGVAEVETNFLVVQTTKTGASPFSTPFRCRRYSQPPYNPSSISAGTLSTRRRRRGGALGARQP